jgi:hypothetical protein
MPLARTKTASCARAHCDDIMCRLDALWQNMGLYVSRLDSNVCKQDNWCQNKRTDVSDTGEQCDDPLCGHFTCCLDNGQHPTREHTVMITSVAWRTPHSSVTQTACISAYALTITDPTHSRLQLHCYSTDTMPYCPLPLAAIYSQRHSHSIPSTAPVRES